jgi:hypothetical protein
VQSLFLLQITEPVSSRKCWTIFSYECEWPFCDQFFTAGALWIWLSHIF